MCARAEAEDGRFSPDAHLGAVAGAKSGVRFPLVGFGSFSGFLLAAVEALINTHWKSSVDYTLAGAKDRKFIFAHPVDAVLDMKVGIGFFNLFLGVPGPYSHKWVGTSVRTGKNTGETAP
jgi:hypothetical protein